MTCFVSSINKFHVRFSMNAEEPINQRNVNKQKPDNMMIIRLFYLLTFLEYAVYNLKPKVIRNWWRSFFTSIAFGELTTPWVEIDSIG